MSYHIHLLYMPRCVVVCACVDTANLLPSDHDMNSALYLNCDCCVVVL